MSQHIYFDLDGTLTDPLEGISRCILYAIDKFDEAPPTVDELRRFIGPPLMLTFSELLDESRAEEALYYYRERFDEIGWQENVPYEGIHDVLGQLQVAGATLYVATTKPWKAAERIIEHFGMQPFFDRVYGSELDGTRTDKTELLAYAIQRNPPFDNAVMIGDRKHDMIGAINNGMNTIGVTYGYGSLEELEAAGAHKIATTPADIKALV